MRMSERKSIFEELHERKEQILEKLASLEDEIAIAQEKWDVEKVDLDDLEACILVLEK
jgi:hypothetical protein